MDLAPRYERSGSGADLVLIHSLGAQLALWDDVVPTFAASYRVLRYDVRGHGRSGGTPGAITIDVMRDDLRALLERLGIGRTHLVGLSMGGMIAQAFAAAHPERVDGLVLADTAAEFDAPIRAAWRERAATARRAGMAPLVEPTVERWFPEGFRRTAPQTCERVRAYVRAMDPEGYAAAGEALARLQLTERLGHIRARTLVAVGELDDAIPQRFSEQLAASIRGARFLRWPGVGHAPPLQIPAAFARDVLAFLGAASVG
jgi:3-oxoadipate enol-lactonase